MHSHGHVVQWVLWGCFFCQVSKTPFLCLQTEKPYPGGQQSVPGSCVTPTSGSSRELPTSQARATLGAQPALLPEGTKVWHDPSLFQLLSSTTGSAVWETSIFFPQPVIRPNRFPWAGELQEEYNTTRWSFQGEVARTPTLSSSYTPKCTREHLVPLF